MHLNIFLLVELHEHFHPFRSVNGKHVQDFSISVLDTQPSDLIAGFAKNNHIPLFTTMLFTTVIECCTMTHASEACQMRYFISKLNTFVKVISLQMLVGQTLSSQSMVFHQHKCLAYTMFISINMP